MRLRLGITLVACVTDVVLTAGPASAGGSWFSPAEDRYEQGETATVVGYSGRGTQGWIENGPYYAYLIPGSGGGGDGDSSLLPPSAVRVGQLLLQETGRGGYLTLRAAITFPIPSDLVSSRYSFTVCNDPCTMGLGELIGGEVWVGVDPPQPLGRSDWPAEDPARQGLPASVPLPAPPPTTTALPTTTTPPTIHERSPAQPAAAPVRVPSDGDGTSFPWLPVGAGVVLLTVVAMAVLRHRRRSSSDPLPAIPATPLARTAAAEELRQPVPVGRPQD
jgi:hypothetical protein